MVTSLTPCFLATSATGVLSASRRILTICSSENLVFFMAPSVPEGPLSQSINWTENRPARQNVLEHRFVQRQIRHQALELHVFLAQSRTHLEPVTVLPSKPDK